MDCFPAAFAYLTSKLSRAQMLEPFPEETANGAIRLFLDKLKSIRNPESIHSDDELVPVNYTGQTINTSDLPLSEAEDIFPCLLVSGGSAFGFSRYWGQQTS